ncbi:MAG TPA: hypothetical protein VF665_17810 [Longimicrobium sp.]|jgi:hypothetical protein|uniref:hypothetical protein n=1 Tax=Longimicrobium sp. TaxID=2029185 RepID=UPI002EDB0024
MIEYAGEMVNLVRLSFLARGIPGAIRRRVRPRYGDRYSPVVSRHLRIASAMLLLVTAAIWFLPSGQPEVIRYVLAGVMAVPTGTLFWSMIVLGAAHP